MNFFKTALFFFFKTAKDYCGPTKILFLSSGRKNDQLSFIILIILSPDFLSFLPIRLKGCYMP